DFGIVGLIALLGFLGWFFAKSVLAYRLAPVPARPLVLALALAHTAMFGLAMGIEAFYQRHWWLVLALIASSYSLTLRPANSALLESESGGGTSPPPVSSPPPCSPGFGKTLEPGPQESELV